MGMREGRSCQQYLTHALVLETAKEQRERNTSSSGRGKEGGFQKQIDRRAEEMETAGRAKDEVEHALRVLHIANCTFEPRQEQAATERRRRDRRREVGGDDEDELQQTFCLFNSALSSAQLHTQNITASSTFATPPFSPLLHTQLSAPSVLVGSPLKPLAPSPPAAHSSSLTQKSLCTFSPSSAALSNMPSFSSSNNSFIGFYRSRNAAANGSARNRKKGNSR